MWRSPATSYLVSFSSFTILFIYLFFERIRFSSIAVIDRVCFMAEFIKIEYLFIAYFLNVIYIFFSIGWPNPEFHLQIGGKNSNI